MGDEKWRVEMGSRDKESASQPVSHLSKRQRKNNKSIAFVSCGTQGRSPIPCWGCARAVHGEWSDDCLVCNYFVPRV